MVSSGKPVNDLGDVDAGPVAGRSEPLARVPVKAAPRDRSHSRDDRRVVWECEYDEPLPIADAAELDVDTIPDHLHRSPRY